ncbi:MAG: hypothetical protein SFV81_26025 [Pirellulaceae bacterium]|nr:hypothetical protein [Pirellulaceae bacterium]
MARYDIDLVKAAAEGRWKEILSSIGNIDTNLLDGSHHACPKQCHPDAGGKDRFRALDDFDQVGGVLCNQCFSTKNRSGFDALMWLTGEDFATVLAKVAKFAGVKPLKGRKKASPTDHLEFLPWNRTLVGLWCLTKKPITIEAVQRLGWKVAKYRKQYTVIAIPIWGPALDAEEPVGWVMYRADGGTLPKYLKKDDPPEWVKVKMTAGSQQGLIADLAKWKNLDVKQWGKVEGPSDLGAIESVFNDVERGWFTTANGSLEKPLDWIVERLNGCKAVVIHDCDKPGQAGATWVEQSDRKRAGWCPVIAEVAEEVRNIVLPFTIEPTHGNDLRDYFKGGATQQDLVELIDKSPIWERSPEIITRPHVVMNLDLGAKCDEVIGHLGRLGWESPWIAPEKRESLKIYQRVDSLVHVITNEDTEVLKGGIEIEAGAVRIRSLPIGQLPLRITDACQLMKETKEDLVQVRPERWLVDGIASRGDWGKYIRRLSGVINAPTIRPDGTILQDDGYDEKTGLLYVPGNRKFPPIPDNPTITDARNAAAQLLDVVKDFPFVDDADRSAWLALVISLIGRPAINGCVPLFAVTASCPGSGKSLLVDAAIGIAYGRGSARMSFSGNDQEQRKAITAVAIEAIPSVLLDNVDCVLKSASLDAALTATIWSDRILSSSKTTGEIPLRTVWMATGNNLRFGSDLARRVMPIRLATKLANPEERTDIEHKNLLGWVGENRPALANAALTILRAYFVAGLPVQAGGDWGSYDSWSALIRGAIVWAGLADPIRTRETAKADDQSVALIRQLIAGLREVCGSELKTAKEICDCLTCSKPEEYPVMREVLAEIGTDDPKKLPRKLGYEFRKFKDRPVKVDGNDCQIIGAENRNSITQWGVLVAGDAGDACDSFNQSSREDFKADNPYPNEGLFKGPCGNKQKQSPASPASPAVQGQCPKCGAMMEPSPEEVNGWRNWDCVCGHVEPTKESTSRTKQYAL